MIRPLIFAIAILIAGATQVMAQGIPRFKVELGCQQVSSGPYKLTTFDNCMENEKSARDDLAKNWETFVASDRRVCLAETSSDGTPSYVELLECLNMARDSRNLNAAGRVDVYQTGCSWLRCLLCHATPWRCVNSGATQLSNHVPRPIRPTFAKSISFAITNTEHFSQALQATMCKWSK